MTLAGFLSRNFISSAAFSSLRFLGLGVGDKPPVVGVLLRFRGDRLRGAAAEK
jgi:hypothetical protein